MSVEPSGDRWGGADAAGAGWSEASAPSRMVPPSGRQFRLVHDDQEAVVTEVGGALRSYTVAGRPVLDGFAEAEPRTDARGETLLPWPGRIGNGRYRFEGEDHQLPLSEPDQRNAIHGLVRWVNWVAEPESAARLVVRYRLHPQDGYPFCLDLAVTFELRRAGLSVALATTNLGTGPAPFGAGFHPYLNVGTPRIDPCQLRVPAATALLADSRMLPTGRIPVEGTELDFRTPRPLGSTQLNTAFTDLARDPDGLARVSLEAPEGRRLVLWMEPSFGWLMVFTGDALPTPRRRRGLAVEPMTCPPDAFRSGEDLTVLGPGETATAGWGIDVTGFRG